MYKHQKDLWDNMAETDRAVKRGGVGWGGGGGGGGRGASRKPWI